MTTKVLVSFLLSSAAFVAANTAQAQMYWRLDTGYSMSTGTDIHDKNSADLVINGDPGFTTSGSLKDVGKAFILGGGVGYRFAKDMRGDVTLGYRGYKLDASDGAGTQFKANVTSTTVMANFYYENIAASGPWSPYIGAGLGLTQNKFGDLTANDPVSGSADAPGGTKSGIAWALMAGFGVPLSKERTLDFGYRYIDLGKIETTGNLVDSAGNVVPYEGATGKLRAHELFVGVRF